jgi:heme exporter protein B
MSFFQQIAALIRKDLVLEIREPDHLLSVFLFGMLLFILFSFALSIEPATMNKMAPGLFWLAVLFTSLRTLDHSFQREMEDGQWEGLLLLGIDPRSLYLGKMISNLCLVLLLQIFLLPLMAVFFDISLSIRLITVLFLGSVGISTLGTFYAALTASIRGGQALLPVLLFPMLVPVLLAAVKVTELTLANDLFGQQTVWLKLLILFDIVFLLGSLLCSEALFERT